MPTPLVEYPLTEVEALDKLFPTIEVARAYLQAQHVTLWGKSYDLANHLEEAAEFLTQMVDAVNGVRQLAAIHQQGLEKAAEVYDQIAFPVNTRHLLERKDT